ncbi:peptidase M61 [Acetobacter oeni]|uniref:Peptidase M61 n=2 Tax=Acetobacter oeni TaxID=304077 RepID=A0A511XJG6_9PROT|nr:putative metalloprotease with PDZ domain [Acetobacter oeni]GBR00898.1 hypothetical protein AA21952_0256 [Acetobacter oeni LMG 21952]GEN63083.1 peptidase M61 [Acetobacter oeni]
MALVAMSVWTISGALASEGPQPLPLPPQIPAAKDIAYPGTVELVVTATDLDRHVLKVSERVPLPSSVTEKGGDVVLLYPAWLPGHHSPGGPISELAGIGIKSGGKPVPWVRDTVNVNTFHIAAPAGTKELELSFQILTPITPREGRVVMTPEIVNVQWNMVALYPAGYFTRDIPYSVKLTLPHGWHYGTALRASQAPVEDTVTFETVPFNTLVDSPVFAGQFFRKIDLNRSGETPVALNVVADRPEWLAATEAQISLHRALVMQAGLLFGTHHYDHYDFLLALTKELGGIGLEHHRSSENSGPEGYFTKWDKTFPVKDLLAHEYTHSWNGKFRRPADLWAPDFNTPQRGSMLWVYEGQTQYWGYVLAARSGLMTPAQTLDAIAMVAAVYDRRSGRTWRPLADTTNDPIIAQRAPLSWRSWQRSEDYYSEGQLIWLDADTLIREKTGGQKSLNNFAKTFFGVDPGSYVTRTYTFDDVVSALNGIVTYDWASFLHDRLDRPSVHAPLDGLKRGGYRLVWTEEASPYLKAAEALKKARNFDFSLGFTVDSKGVLTNVEWDSPAWNAGLAVDETIVAVNGMAFDGDDLADAVKEAKVPAKDPLTLLVRTRDRFRTVVIPYHLGLRYPHLERVAGSADVLGTILMPLK